MQRMTCLLLVWTLALAGTTPGCDLFDGWSNYRGAGSIDSAGTDGLPQSSSGPPRSGALRLVPALSPGLAGLVFTGVL
jgi:hypothetical protein